MSTQIRCILFELRRRGEKKEKKRHKKNTGVRSGKVQWARLDRLSDDLGISRDLEPGDEFAAARQGQGKQEQALRSTRTLL